MAYLALFLAFVLAVLAFTHPIAFVIALGFLFFGAPILAFLGYLAFMVAGVVQLRRKS
jgi:hypothetical protein